MAPAVGDELSVMVAVSDAMERRRAVNPAAVASARVIAIRQTVAVSAPMDDSCAAGRSTVEVTCGPGQVGALVCPIVRAESAAGTSRRSSSTGLV